MKISNKIYDILKYIALTALPAIAVFYVAIGKIWPSVPYPSEISATIMAVDALLGALLCISSSQYNKNSNNGSGDSK